MKKRSFMQLLFAVIFILTFIIPLHAGGESDAPGPAGITVEDAFGRMVNLEGVPRKIVLAGKAVMILADALYLFPGTAEQVTAVGWTNQGLGDFFPFLDPDAASKQTLGNDPGAEQVASYNPDLVLLKNSMKSTLGSTLEALGIPVVYLSLETPEDYIRDIRVLARILKQEKRGEEILSFFNTRLRNLQEIPGTGETGLPESVLILNYTERGGNYSFSISPESWIQSSQVQLAGGRPVWFDSAVSPGWNQVQFEQIAAWDPDRIIILSYQTPSVQVLERLRADPLWARLKAVKNDHLHAFPSDFYSWGQPDTRWILGTQWMSRVLYPQAYSGKSFEDDIFLFFRDFYGMDRDFVRKNISPVLQGSLLK